MALFRREALAGRGQVLDGAVSLAVPLSWQIIGGLLFTCVAGAALFLAFARTDRLVGAQTWVVHPDRARAILAEADAVGLRRDACGHLTLMGSGTRRRACIIRWAGPELLALPSGDAVRGWTIELAIEGNVPPGAGGTTRFAAGRQSLWASLT